MCNGDSRNNYSTTSTNHGHWQWIRSLLCQYLHTAKSELTATIHSVTRSQFFLEYNFNYTNVTNFLVWYKTDFANLTNEEIKSLKAKVLKLPTRSMDIFDKVLENIDENYSFSLSAKLILALLVAIGICFITFGIIFIWYKRKTSLTFSTIGNLVKLVPSLIEKTLTLNSLLPILSELNFSENNQNKNVATSTAVSQLPQTPSDELILPPILVPQLQMETAKPTTSTPLKSPNVTTEPLSLELFNHAAADLDQKATLSSRSTRSFYSTANNGSSLKIHNKWSQHGICCEPGHWWGQYSRCLVHWHCCQKMWYDLRSYSIS